MLPAEELQVALVSLVFYYQLDGDIIPLGGVLEDALRFNKHVPYRDMRARKKPKRTVQALIKAD